MRLFLQNQKALLESEERFRSLVNASPIGIGVIDNKTNSFMSSNPALCKMLGFSEEELSSINLKDIVHPEDVFSMFADRNKLMRQESPSYRTERRYLTRSLETLWVKVSGALIRSPLGTNQEFRLIEDITAEKIAEEKVKALMAELSHSNAELERFSQVASHDLKSPLNTISNFAWLLSKQVGSTLTPEAKKSLTSITDSCARLRELIEDLLIYSRVNHAANHFELINCGVVLEDVLKNLAFDIESCGATIQYEKLPLIMGDRIQLMQLFQNLISNAIKYRSQEYPKVQIKVEEKNEEWLFSVQDNGVGFSMEHAETIFAEFQRLQSTNVSGTGLGLPICRTIVKRHGGKIWANSINGKGSTFFFNLPKQGSNGGLSTKPFEHSLTSFTNESVAH